MTRCNEIVDWLINYGGICPDWNNGFGGDPSAQPQLNLKIQQRPSELAECIDFFLQKKSSGDFINFYAEIGACSGGTARAMHEFLQFQELLIIDDGGKCAEQFYVHNRSNHSRGNNLNFIPRVEIIGSSAEDRVIQHAVNLSKIHYYDILFIDGDHSYQGVKNDTLNYLQILRQGGYIIFHDTAHIPEIQAWINEMPSVLPTLSLVKHIANADQFTSLYPEGFGISIYQKL